MSLQSFLNLGKTGRQRSPTIPLYQREQSGPITNTSSYMIGAEEPSEKVGKSVKSSTHDDKFTTGLLKTPNQRPKRTTSASASQPQSKRKRLSPPRRKSTSSLLDDEGPLGEFVSLAKAPVRTFAPPIATSSGTKLGWAQSPWSTKKYSMNVALALHEEIEDFVKFISCTESEKKMRIEVVDRIKAIVLDLWPSAEIHLFGSVAAGIFLPTSDIDMVIIGKWSTLPLNTLANALTDAKIPSKMQVISHARVPIIKLKDAATSVDVDISFNMSNGPEEAERIKQYLTLYPALRPLTLVIKQYLSQRSLNEVYSGGLGSYAILLTILSFLQMHPRQDKHQNLGVLLIEFFELYGTQFNYEKVVISILNGGKYFRKRGQWVVEKRPQLLSIQNPRSPEEDVCRNSFAIDAIRRAFEHAYYVLTSAFSEPPTHQKNRVSDLGSRKTLLSRIVRLPQEVVDYRAWIAQNFGGGLSAHATPFNISHISSASESLIQDVSEYVAEKKPKKKSIHATNNESYHNNKPGKSYKKGKEKKTTTTEPRKYIARKRTDKRKDGTFRVGARNISKKMPHRLSKENGRSKNVKSKSRTLNTMAVNSTRTHNNPTAKTTKHNHNHNHRNIHRNSDRNSHTHRNNNSIRKSNNNSNNNNSNSNTTKSLSKTSKGGGARAGKQNQTGKLRGRSLNVSPRKILIKKTKALTRRSR